MFKLYLKNYFYLSTIFIFAFIFAMMGTISLHAQNTNSQIPFTINAIKPNNQINKKAGYLDLLIKPNQQQRISFSVNNISNQEQHFIVDAGDATTSDGLAIDFNKNNQKILGDTKFSNLINENKFRQYVTVPANSSKVVSFDLKMPPKHFDGILMGGITLYLNSKYQKNDSNQSGSVGIKNRFTYAIAVVLRNNFKKVQPDLHILDAFQSTVNYRPVVKTTIQNDKNNFIKGLSTNTIIKNSDGKKVVSNKTMLGQIAPISQFNLTTQLDHALPAGKYYLYGSAKDASNREWHWQKQFTVTNKNYNNVSSKDAFNDNEINWYIVIIVILIIIILGMLIYLIIKKRNDDNEKQ